MKTHHVLVKLVVPDDVSFVEASTRVSAAVEPWFQDREGPIEVSGIDPEREARKLAEVTVERNAWHEAWTAMANERGVQG